MRWSTKLPRASMVAKLFSFVFMPMMILTIWGGEKLKLNYILQGSNYFLCDVPLSSCGNIFSEFL